MNLEIGNNYYLHFQQFQKDLIPTILLNPFSCKIKPKEAGLVVSLLQITPKKHFIKTKQL